MRVCGVMSIYVYELWLSGMTKTMFERRRERNQCQDWGGLFPLVCSVLLIERSDPSKTKIASPFYRQLQLRLTQSHDAGKNSFILNRLDFILQAGVFALVANGKEFIYNRGVDGSLLYCFCIRNIVHCSSIVCMCVHVNNLLYFQKSYVFSFEGKDECWEEKYFTMHSEFFSLFPRKILGFAVKHGWLCELWHASSSGRFQRKNGFHTIMSPLRYIPDIKKQQYRKDSTVHNATSVPQVDS